MFEEISRSILVFVHLMFFSGAIVLVMLTDFFIFKNGVSEPLIHGVARYVLTLLLGLWITGLLIVLFDTGFQISLILSNSKVSIKFVCVFVLTLNGMALHMVGLQMLTSKGRMSRPQAIVLCVMGALSTTNWLLAGFIGSANMLTAFSFQVLLLDYLVITLLACTCGYLLSSIVRKRLNFHRARAALKELGIDPTLDPSSFIFNLPFKQSDSLRVKLPQSTRRILPSRVDASPTDRNNTKTFAPSHYPVVN